LYTDNNQDAKSLLMKLLGLFGDLIRYLLTTFRLAVRDLIAFCSPKRLLNAIGRLLARIPRPRISEETRLRIRYGTLITLIAGPMIWVVAWIVVTRGRGSTFDQYPHLALGRAAANETARLLDGRGRVVVVGWHPGSSRYRLTDQRLRLREFERALRKHPGLRLLDIELVPLHKIHPTTKRMSGVFEAIVAAHPDADVIVSLVGVPDLTDEQLARLEDGLPQFVVVTDLVAGLPAFFERNLVTLAIVPRYELPGPELEDPTDLDEVFEHSFQVVTDGDLARLIRLFPRQAAAHNAGKPVAGARH
jgi:hypothetical protein